MPLKRCGYTTAPSEKTSTVARLPHALESKDYSLILRWSEQDDASPCLDLWTCIDARLRFACLPHALALHYLSESASWFSPCWRAHADRVSARVSAATAVAAFCSDASALGTAIARLLSSPGLRREMGARARASVAARYDIGRLLADIDALYRDLLRSQPSCGS